MNILNDFLPEHRSLIVALPYRVGLWISQVDNTGGDEAKAKELGALSNIIHGFAHDVFGSEFVQHVMTETLARKGEWEAWGEDFERIPKECAQAVEIMKAHVDQKEIKAYAARLMEIAEAVALAFREYENMEKFSDKLEVYIAYWRAKLKSTIKKRPLKSFDQFLSVSAMERRALMRIAGALNIEDSY
jgi:hypothetical protein